MVQVPGVRACGARMQGMTSWFFVGGWVGGWVGVGGKETTDCRVFLGWLMVMAIRGVGYKLDQFSCWLL